MSNSNKSARETLEKIYGKHCFICQGIRKLNPPKPHKGSYRGKCIATQLTYHHLRPKHLGGKATIENGANLCRRCHDWLEQLDKASRERVNNELRAYKREHSKECKVEFVDDLPLNFEIKAMIFTPEELTPKKQKYNRAKDKRELQEELRKWENEQVKKPNPDLDLKKKRGKNHIDEEWQEKIMQDNWDEMRL